jgi:hypothetical protein
VEMLTLVVGVCCVGFMNTIGAAAGVRKQTSSVLPEGGDRTQPPKHYGSSSNHFSLLVSWLYLVLSAGKWVLCHNTPAFLFFP